MESAEPLQNAARTPPEAVWDVSILDYDTGRFPFRALAEGMIAEAGYPGVRLERLHEEVPDHEVMTLLKQLGKATREPAFQAVYRRFAAEVIQPLCGVPIALQRYANVRALLPNQAAKRIPFHTDSWYGHSPDERNVWLPLTAAYDSNSMQIMDFERSLSEIDFAVRNELSLGEMEARFAPRSRPVVACYGQVALFTPLHLHGNLVNETGATRMSIDFRVAPKGFRPNKKYAGGYFEILEG